MYKSLAAIIKYKFIVCTLTQHDHAKKTKKFTTHHLFNKTLYLFTSYSLKVDN